MAPDPSAARGGRTALVLSGGGARGAYEAGVLSHIFEQVIPKLPPGFDFDVVSGTSVGAIHAAYVAATTPLAAATRSQRILEAWLGMLVAEVLDLSLRDLLRIPLRALGLSVRSARRGREGVVGGLVDVSPLEQLVNQRVPWDTLRRNLAGPRPRALCVSCTEVRSGRVTVFMDGALADPAPWTHDPNAEARVGEIGPRHVRASAAIPFLFPAVRILERYYVDGGLRMNTPLSPALRLGADKILVVGLKHPPPPSEGLPAYSDDVITQPAFLLGKVLDALMLDQLEYELRRVALVNALIERGTGAFGGDFLERINVAVREQRGADYRPVQTAVIRPSEDLGRLAAECYRRSGGVRAVGALAALVARAALRGVPRGEGDLLSYLYFDRCYTGPLVELGREDARRQQDEILALLGA